MIIEENGIISLLDLMKEDVFFKDVLFEALDKYAVEYFKELEFKKQEKINKYIKSLEYDEDEYEDEDEYSM